MSAPVVSRLLLGLGVWIGHCEAHAAVRLGQICTVDGQTEIRLEGTGLVVGLSATGDGGDNRVTMQHFAQYLALNGVPVENLEQLKKHGGSVALVAVSAAIPATGVSRGQRLDCQVSVLFGCKSLSGGRLILTAMTGEELASDAVLALAEGGIVVDDQAKPTTGRITSGVVMKESVDVRILRKARQIRLLINKQHAGFAMAREVERAINERFYLEASNQQIAKAASAVAVDVHIPEQYDNPVEFAALLEEVALKEAAARPRVVVNAKNGTIVVTGDVEIGPAVISHKNLSVDITDPFVPLQDRTKGQVPQQLTDLVDSLNRLRVPTADTISILRTLHDSGRLHAEFIEQ